MRPTARFWTLGLVAGVLTLWAVVLNTPLPFAGTVGISAWLLGQQYRFTQLATNCVETLQIEHQPSQRQVSAEDETLVSVSLDADEPLPFDCTVTPSLPAGAEHTASSVTVERGERTGSLSVVATWPVAGTFTLEPPTLTMTDPLGLFEHAVTQGPQASITVEPRAPRNVHVGQGGDTVTAGFGEHEADRTGSGLEPAAVREYMPGDTVRNIDWKATARLGEPHVREFEAETDRETVLFVDHRDTMGCGQSGQTKLDYARQVALAFVDSARELTDPLGCYSVGDEGVTGSFDPAASADHQLGIRRHVERLEPTVASHAETTRGNPAPPSRAQTIQRRLDDDTEYSRRLTPLLDRPDAYVERVVDQPLVAAVRSMTARFDGTVWSVILTDDRHETEVREAAKLARRGQGHVLVFLTPTVLYEPGGLASLDDAYHRYSEFEEFRQSLATMDRVSAFEVGPADRLSAVLASGRSQWADTEAER